MKNATPSDKRKRLALEKIDSLETEVIAEKYRKIGGIDGHQFDFLIDKYEWTSFLYRKDFVSNIINTNSKLEKAFVNFRKALAKKYPEYQYLIMREDWNFVVQEILLFGGIQYDTEVPFENISWFVSNDKEKALYLKILPGGDKKQIADFLNKKENNLINKFKEIGVSIKRQKNRARKEESYNFDLWVRVLDTFSSEEIRDAFALKFPTEYKSHFSPNGKRIALYRAKYELIAHYLFHRFNLKSPKNGPYKADYVKAIIEKAKKNKTQIKIGLFKQIP